MEGRDEGQGAEGAISGVQEQQVAGDHGVPHSEGGGDELLHKTRVGEAIVTLRRMTAGERITVEGKLLKKGKGGNWERGKTGKK